MVFSSCGGHEQTATTPPPTVTPTASAQKTAAPAKARIRITAPKKGASVQSHVTVRGKAAPGTTVLLDGGCSAAGCQSLGLAGTNGAWHADIRLTDAKSTITASTADSKPLDSVTVAVATAVATAPPKLPHETEPQTTPAPAPKRVVMVGDSLSVGTANLLPALLPGKTVSTNGRIGRPLAEGMGIINGLDLTSQPTVLLVSLFTNDGPTATDQLAAAVRQTLADVGDDGCAVWATIVRPPYNGVSYANANKVLHELEAHYYPKMILVPWAETVAEQPSLVGGDGVHGTTEGYQVRAQLYAQAAQECSP
jgi:hypothetical protein